MADICPFEVKPLAISKPVNRVPIYNLNYTNQDYWSIKGRMFDILKKNFQEDFNDFNESSIGVMLLEMWAFIADMLSFKIDQIANEVFVDTCTEIESMFRLAKLVGFKPTPPLPSKAMFIASINATLSHDVEIKTPAYINIYDSDGQKIPYELFPADVYNNPIYDSPIIIPAGKTNTNAIVGIQGKTVTTKFIGLGVPHQVVTLRVAPALYGSIVVKVDGVIWDQVEYFTDAQPRLEYRVEYDHKYRAVLIFGDNKSGLVPPEGSPIEITYRAGGGSFANIVTGSVDEKFYVTIPGLTIPLPVHVTNYTKGELGYNGDTIEDIRKKMPAYIRSQDRAVTGHDYKNLANGFASPVNGVVGKAVAALRNHGCAGNVVDLYILAQDSKDNLIKPTQNLIDELTEYVGERKIFTDYLCVKSGEVILVDVNIDVFLDRSFKKFEDTIREKIDRRLTSFFLISNWDFGQTLREADIIKTLADIKEVGNFGITFTTAQDLENMNGTNSIIPCKYNQIIRPDNVVLAFTYRNPEDI